jgi:hypothetical protein
MQLLKRFGPMPFAQCNAQKLGRAFFLWRADYAAMQYIEWRSGRSEEARPLSFQQRIA